MSTNFTPPTDGHRDEQLNAIGPLAERYSLLTIRDHADDRTEMKSIAATVRGFDAMATAYFCQQLISYFDDVHKATMALTVLTNRLR